MTHYTFTVLNERAEIIEKIIHNCANDLDAFEIAQKVSEDRVVEVWTGARRLFRLKPRQALPGPSISQSG